MLDPEPALACGGAFDVLAVVEVAVYGPLGVDPVSGGLALAGGKQVLAGLGTGVPRGWGEVGSACAMAEAYAG